MGFIKGLVDSDDLPLNVSREQLQQLKKDGGEDWKTFYSNYATAIKLGVIEDSANRARLSKLMQFESTTTGELTSLTDYVERMKKGQDQIYFLAGQDKDELLKSPLLERFQSRGIEVLLMTDSIDEYVTQNLAKFDGKYTLTGISKEGVKLPGESDDQFITAEMEETFKPLLDFLKDNVEGVNKVVLSKRLTTSPAALVSGSFGYSANMERIVRAQALGDRSASWMMNGQKQMEINPRHSIIKALLAKVEAEETESAKSVAALLYETARLRSGFEVSDPASFAASINEMLAKQLDTDVSAETFEEVVEEEEEDDEEEEDEEFEEDEVEEAEEAEETNKDEL